VSQTDSQHFILKVVDNGVGIESANIQFIFDRFTKIESKETEGFGLGLSIVNSIVNFHHGKIEVQSQPGQGSTFTVSFPLKFLKG
jgi:signal transduction histidine kinase